MKSLHQRLTMTHTAVALLAVVLIALLVSGLVLRAYNELARSQSAMVSRALADPLAQYYVRNGGWDNLATTLRLRILAGNVPLARRTIITDADWQVLFDSTDTLTGQPAPLLMRRQSAPIYVQERIVGFVIVPPPSRDEFSTPERTFLRSVIMIVIVGGIVASATALVVALFVAQRLTRPLGTLTTAARRLAAGEHHQPIALPDEAELAELAGAFNTMAAELERQEGLRRQMVADIAHELRTPLSVLRLRVEGMEDGIEQPSPELYAALVHEVDLLNRLVDDLRLLSLAEAGKLALNVEPVAPQAALARAAAAASPRARQQGIDLQIDVSPDVPLISADGQRLAQILGNLIENALRYTPRNGKVTLRAKADGQASVRFEVTDTGPGIAPDDLPHIFDRFFRADRARTRETGGSGLGLAIVQRLVEAHGGTISVTSTPGNGTTFEFTLPAMLSPR